MEQEISIKSELFISYVFKKVCLISFFLSLFLRVRIIVYYCYLNRWKLPKMETFVNQLQMAKFPTVIHEPEKILTGRRKGMMEVSKIFTREVVALTFKFADDIFHLSSFCFSFLLFFRKLSSSENSSQFTRCRTNYTKTQHPQKRAYHKKELHVYIWTW